MSDEDRTLARVDNDQVDMAQLVAAVETPRSGAVATFAGTVRDHHQGQAVAFLEYEAYESMALRVLGEVLDEAAAQWPIDRATAHHRLGRLEIGEISIGIAVSSAHRGPAFEALRYVIDELKVRVPIWKRETGPDGTHWIEGPDLVPVTARAQD